MIDRATVDRIVDAAKIVDVVGDFVTLRKSGVNYKGLCPFHDDRNPSFIVSPSKNICHCFVCGKGGTPAGFLMEHEQISYPDALRWLAKKYNIEIVEKELTDEERQQQGERESMFVVNEWARDYFHSTLLDGSAQSSIGLAYFRSRQIRDDIIEKFQLGYALPQRNAMGDTALKKGYKREFLVKTGLCYQRDDGTLADRYAGRVIFPWLNVSGKVVAFGGRLLDSRTKGVAQKYVNSPDSDIYHKERELYGLYQAKRAIVKDDRVFMVEGYTDVIAMHQAGIENVVANSGTALSYHQINMLNRFTQNITLLYDGDEAGIHAAMRGTDMLLEQGMNVKVLLLPDGDDPDSFARKHSSEELRKYIDEHQADFISFKTRLTVQGIDDPVERSKGIEGIVNSIAVIPNPILRSTYITDLSQRIGMKEQTLLNSLNARLATLRQAAQQQAQQQAQRQAQQSGQQTAPAETQPAEGQPIEQPQPTIAIAPTGRHEGQLTMQIIREVVRNGHEIIYRDVETGDGTTINLNVAQYIDYDLSADGLTLADPLYDRMLREAVDQSGQPDFNSMHYFTNHPDPEVSQLATTLSLDRYQLGGRFVMEETEDTLRQRVVHLVMEYRKQLVEEQLRQMRAALNSPPKDMTELMKMLEEYKSLQELRDTLAKELGNSVMKN